MGLTKDDLVAVGWMKRWSIDACKLNGGKNLKKTAKCCIVHNAYGYNEQCRHNFNSANSFSIVWSSNNFSIKKDEKQETNNMFEKIKDQWRVSSNSLSASESETEHSIKLST